MKKPFALAVAVAAFAAAVALPAFAQSYPTKPIRMVVPFPPGGISDIVARPVADGMSATLGQPVIIDNRPGAGGRIGADAVARAAPDGYTVGFITAGTHGILSAIDPKLSYDAVKDFTPITRLQETPFVLLAHPSVAAKNAAELVAAARAKPGAIHYGTPGLGSGHHMAAELFRAATGAQITHVPYKGEAPAMTDLLSGQIQIMLAPSGYRHVLDGKLRGLATTGERRWHLLPDVPTLKEQGVDASYVGWTGLAAPAGTPPEIVSRLHAAAKAALARPDIHKRFVDLGYAVVGDEPAQAAQRIRDDIAKWRKLVAEQNLKFEN
jgi:tripartite-type tricarboxylate transporter receptor subunit TctC